MRPPVLRPAHDRPTDHGRRALLSAAAALLTLVGLLAMPGAASARAATWQVPFRSEGPATTLDEFEDQLMIAINTARRQHDRKRIRVYDRCADRLAEKWGSHLADTGLFEHRDQHQVLRRCDVTWAGENLVRGTDLTPESMVQAWMDSPGHREILLNDKARRAGVSVTQDGDGRLVGVLNVVRGG